MSKRDRRRARKLHGRNWKLRLLATPPFPRTTSAPVAHGYVPTAMRRVIRASDIKDYKGTRRSQRGGTPVETWG